MAVCGKCIHKNVCDLCNQLGFVNVIRANDFNCKDYLPTADVEEVKHAKWKTVPMFDEPDCDYISFECSCCGNLDVCEENYCSECGAKMDGGKGE